VNKKAPILTVVAGGRVRQRCLSLCWVASFASIGQEKNALVAPVEMKTKSALWVQERIARAQAIAGIRRKQSMEVMT
jgi:hypothetical protein